MVLADGDEGANQAALDPVLTLKILLSATRFQRGIESYHVTWAFHPSLREKDYFMMNLSLFVEYFIAEK